MLQSILNKSTLPNTESIEPNTAIGSPKLILPKIENKKEKKAVLIL